METIDRVNDIEVDDGVDAIVCRACGADSDHNELLDEILKDLD